MRYSYTYSLLFPALAVAVGVNPDPTFDPATSQGDFGPGGNGFTPVRDPAPGANGAPRTVSGSDATLLQQAADGWSIDTGTVSFFQDNGKSAGQGFNVLANGAFVAEVDELFHKNILDGIIGNDPQVSIANLTLTNGVFQSVVNNLQIMSVQGSGTQSLIDQINKVRCTQILPSIDTYLAVAARTIGQGATLRKAVRPAACAAILAQNANNPDAFPNVPNVPGGTPLGQQDPAGGAGGGAGGNGGTGTGGTRGGAGAGNGGTATSTRGGAGAGTRAGSTATRGGAGAGNGGAATATPTSAAGGRGGQAGGQTGGGAGGAGDNADTGADASAGAGDGTATPSAGAGDATTTGRPRKGKKAKRSKAARMFKS